ncbi:MmcQ/YjbR family DNA-binding protein [Kutzneria chonburiensis]|uniref:MmcQ/YjbR family DNA-binding protein n=1 Tax=Kutzneria chonburiensis TaxID=1483604 RepID=A0ABV6MM91_9PSEU|nr:MmcQ/YjbR family DNA-binding protein [Kutzneria chonburiensis]
MPTSSAVFHRILDALDEVASSPAHDWTSFSVRGKRFGYYWPRTETVGLKQTITEQQALVSERPDVFEEQFTSGGFGWVVVYLDGVEPDELAELVYEAWRLSAPDELADGLPFTKVAKACLPRVTARKRAKASR